MGDEIMDHESNVTYVDGILSKHGVPGRSEQILIQIWCHASFILGVFGNTFVLYATIYHRAIKMDKMSVWIIQNLAAADIGNCIFVLLPNIIALNSGWIWILGAKFCKLAAAYSYVLLEYNILLVNVLSLNKLLRILFPLRNLVSTFRQRLSVTLIIMTIGPGPMYWIVYNVIVEEQSLRLIFDNQRGLCSFERLEPAAKWIEVMDKLLSSIHILVPGAALVLLNLSLIIVAVMKSNHSVHKTNIFIVVLVTGCLSICAFPFFISRIKAKSNDEFQRFAWFVLYSSSWMNTPIYISTNCTFRRFIQRVLKIGAPQIIVRTSNKVQSDTK